MESVDLQDVKAAEHSPECSPHTTLATGVLMEGRYRTFKDFYPFYLSEHGNRNSRRLHFIGTTIGLVMFISGVVIRNGWWLLAAFITGYALAFSGHFLFEKNHPATFKYPLYSFAGDWIMWKDILTGRIRF